MHLICLLRHPDLSVCGSARLCPRALGNDSCRGKIKDALKIAKSLSPAAAKDVNAFIFSHKSIPTVSCNRSMCKL